MKPRDTRILPIRIKNTLFELVDARVAKRKVSRNSWLIWTIKQGLRPHVRKGDVNYNAPETCYNGKRGTLVDED